MSWMKDFFTGSNYSTGMNDANAYFSNNDNKLAAVDEAVTNLLTAPDGFYDRSYTYGYLTEISQQLDRLIAEARHESMLIYFKEDTNERNRTREDDSGSEGDTLSGDGDDNGEAGGAEEDSAECDGSDQDSSEAD